MTRISIFGKAECAKCKTTKHKLTHLVSGEMVHKVELVFHDQDTLDGRAEGAFYDVNPNAIPLTVVEREGREVARWDGVVPNSQDIHRLIVGA
jgi:thioredoxin-like negative regulator of GroEL